MALLSREALLAHKTAAAPSATPRPAGANCERSSSDGYCLPHSRLPRSSAPPSPGCLASSVQPQVRRLQLRDSALGDGDGGGCAVRRVHAVAGGRSASAPSASPARLCLPRRQQQPPPPLLTCRASAAPPAGCRRRGAEGASTGDAGGVQSGASAADADVLGLVPGRSAGLRAGSADPPDHRGGAAAGAAGGVAVGGGGFKSVSWGEGSEAGVLCANAQVRWAARAVIATASA